jgi:hypothetical protein
MQEPEGYEQYPTRIVLLSNLLSVFMYLTGVFLVFQFGLVWAILYLLFIFLLEFRLLGSHCVDCYYYGKTCALGKGRLSRMVFPKGIPERFCNKTITWKDIIPDFLVFIIPVLAGIVLLFIEFHWTILVLVIVLFMLGFFGNAFVRGQLACRYCKQKEIGCPAAQLFDKKISK